MYPQTPVTAKEGQGFPDPFAPRPGRAGAAFLHSLLATALFRCWHIILFYGAWATFITVWNHNHPERLLVIVPTLLTVFGTVVGFVISYRTSSSYERYNEGRRYWSQIIEASRTFARAVWFHVKDAPDNAPSELVKARVLIEKKTVVNLLEAYAVGVKHYLRGEDGIYYEDLYHLVKFLPAYGLPKGIVPSSGDQVQSDGTSTPSTVDSPETRIQMTGMSDVLTQRNGGPPQLPLPVSTGISASATRVNLAMKSAGVKSENDEKMGGEEGQLMPARMPPGYSFFDMFPFSLLVSHLTHRGVQINGKKAARARARLRHKVSHNLPLEITLYLSSYVASLQKRNVIDPPTNALLLNTVNQLVDALVGLERILTTPIPWSYHCHLWEVTCLYVLSIPLQVWEEMGWFTIPATVVLSFVFFGFLSAGEEIENPFGYHKNDLNMDHFTHNIIRQELRAITASPVPDPAEWAFGPDNDLVFASHVQYAERIQPSDWINRGSASMLNALANY